MYDEKSKHFRGLYLHTNSAPPPPQVIVIQWIRSITLFILLSVFLTSTSILFAADVPKAINYQGKLFYDGGPADGYYDFIITLFDASTDGTARWTKTFNTAPGIYVDNGLFTLTLSDDDESVNIYDVLTQYENLYIEVRVQPHSGSGYTTLSPREKLLVAPWALTVPNKAITPAKLSDGTSAGQVLEWNGTVWELKPNESNGELKSESGSYKLYRPYHSW